MATLRVEAVKHCENCGKELFGRTDKRFCNDGCRNQFNREKAFREQQNSHDNLPEIFKIIRRNYEILKSMHIDEGTALLSPEGSLKDEGVDPRFFTSIHIEGDHLWKFCFERGWYEFEDGGWQVRDRPEQAEISY